MSKSKWFLISILGLFLNSIGSVVLAFSTVEKEGIGITGSIFRLGVQAKGDHLLALDKNTFGFGLFLIIVGFILQLIYSYYVFLTKNFD